MEILIITRWAIDAPRGYLAQAIQFARLPMASLHLEIPEAPLGVVHPGRLVYPTFLVPEGHGWLTALAHLVTRNVEIQLHQIETPVDDPNRVLATRRIFPGVNEDLLAVLRGFSSETAHRMEDLTDRVERAFSLLRLPASPEAKGFLSE